MNWLRSGLFRKFAAVLGVLALLPVAFLGFQLINISRRGIQAAVLELQTKTAENLAGQVDDYLKVSNEKISFALASLRKQMDWPEKQELMRSLIDTHADIIEISMLNASGMEMVKVYNPDLGSQEALVSRTKEPGFKEFLKSRRRTINLLGAGARSGEQAAPVVSIFYPMSQTVTARILLSLRALGARIAAERVGGTGFAVFVDAKGQPLLYPEGRLTPSVLGRLPQWPIVRAAIQSNSVGSSEFADSQSRQSYVGAYAPVYSLGGAVVILQSRDEAYEASGRMKKTAALVVSLVVLISIFSATLMARRLTLPLFALARGAEAVARGDFHAEVSVKTGDELQDLAETFNRMIGQLRNYSELQVDRIIAEQRKTGAILYSINDGILMADQKGVVQLANRKSLEMLGFDSPAAIEGKALSQALPEGAVKEIILKAASDPSAGVFKDVDLSTEKNRRYLRVTAHPVVTPEKGAGMGVIVALRDVTLERELDQMKDDFLHYVTHDLRNPLGSAIGFVDVLLKGTAGVLNPEQQSIVSSIKRSSSRLMSMINNILDIAKMESGRIRLGLKTVSLAGIGGRAIGILESLAKVKEISVSLQASEEFSLEADPDMIERVMVNLLGNAIKYTPLKGAVTISITDEGPSLKVCVADTGEGIPAEYLDRIFLKFEQVTGQRRGGTGLGLTIVKFFIEAHLGTIWVESQEGKGSRFYFTLPKNLCQNEDGVVLVGEGVA